MRRLHKRKGNSYEEIDISVTGAVGREKQKHFRNRVVRPVRDQRGGGNLAICRAARNLTAAGNREHG